MSNNEERSLNVHNRCHDASVGRVLACSKSPEQLAKEFGCDSIASDFLETGAALENRIALKTLALRMDVSDGEAEDVVVYCIALALDLNQAAETATAEAFQERLKRAAEALDPQAVNRRQLPSIHQPQGIQTSRDFRNYASKLP